MTKITTSRWKATGVRPPSPALSEPTRWAQRTELPGKEGSAATVCTGNPPTCFKTQETAAPITSGRDKPLVPPEMSGSNNTMPLPSDPATALWLADPKTRCPGVPCEVVHSVTTQSSPSLLGDWLVTWVT